MADYSHRSLVQKLGYKPDFVYSLVNEPSHYRELIFDLPETCSVDETGDRADLIHAFFDNEAELRVMLPELRSRIKKNGMIWISWPKKSSKVPTDLSGDVVRRTGLGNELVDVKVCSVDAIWSGLKFVIPKELR